MTPSAQPTLEGRPGSRAPRPRRAARAAAALTAHPRILAALVAVAAVAAITVADLPTRSTPAYRAHALAGYVAGIEGDVAECSAGVSDAVRAATGALRGAPDASVGMAGTLTQHAIAACSFTNNGVVDLAGLQPPPGTASPVTDAIAPSVARWVFPTAFTMLQALATVLDHPAARAPRRRFAAEVRLLQADRRRVEDLVGRAERAPRAAASPFRLVSLQPLLPGGGLPGAARAAGSGAAPSQP